VTARHRLNAAARARIWGAATAAVGAATLLRPRTAARLVSGGGSVPDTALVRVLGGRQLVQGTVVVLRPVPILVIGAVAVDAVHAASMLAAALAWPGYRNAALASATAAGASAVAGTLILRGLRR
jgi:uncharacterized protein YjeT (DUF2065 family)